MPSQARSEVFDPREVNTLHCYCRFSQQSWLFGQDPKTGEDGSSRREWLNQLLEYVVRLFAIEIGFTNTMSNHYHMVMRNLPYLIAELEDETVIYRWVQVAHLTKSKDGILREPTDEQLEKERAKCLADPTRIEKLRVRLADPSEFMKCVNENLGRRLNAETGASGRVFEERFQAKPILDEGAQLLTALYVDLNAIRAGEVDRIEDSQFSSACLRLLEWLEQNANETPDRRSAPVADLAEGAPIGNDGLVSDDRGDKAHSADALEGTTAETELVAAEAPPTQDEVQPASSSPSVPSDITPAQPSAAVVPKQGPPAPRAPRAAWLSPIELKETPQTSRPPGTPAEKKGSSTRWRPSDRGWLPITFEEYISLLDWAAQEVRADKRGATPSNLEPLLVRVGLNPDVFIEQLAQFRKLFRFAIGSRASIRAAAEAKGKRRRPLKATDKLFTPA